MFLLKWFVRVLLVKVLCKFHLSKSILYYNIASYIDMSNLQYYIAI